MRIGELRRRTGATLRALRYYEELGLGVPSRRPNGYRDYPDISVQQVQQIRELTGLGLSVEQTRPFVECLAAGHADADDCASSLAVYRRAIDDLTHRIDTLGAWRERLQRLLDEAADRAIPIRLAAPVPRGVSGAPREQPTRPDWSASGCRTWRSPRRTAGSSGCGHCLACPSFGYVSLRAEAWEKAGNRIEQKVIPAYALPGNAGPQPTGTTERVSVASDGSQADGGSQAPPAISADGRYVAFSADATNLVPGAPDLHGGVFVHDRATGATERVSVASDGTPATGTGAKVSADGRYVAFASSAATLVPEDRNNTTDIFVRGRQAGTVERVSVGSDRTEADSFSSGPAISADGRYVGFTSRASDLVAGDTNAETDVFVYDRQTGDVERVSVARDGTEANAGAFTAFAFSADGRFTAFVSSASNLVPGDTNGRADTFVRDRGQPR